MIFPSEWLDLVMKIIVSYISGSNFLHKAIGKGQQKSGNAGNDGKHANTASS